MITISVSKLVPIELNSPKLLPPSPPCSSFFSAKILPFPHLSATVYRRRTLRLTASCSNSPSEAPAAEEDEWLKKLPEKTKPLYAHSLPCVEAWLKNLGFYQSKENRAIWFIELPEWHAQLSLDVTDLYIRYLKTGPGNLEKDVERRFSYALSREDIENAILGGP